MSDEVDAEDAIAEMATTHFREGLNCAESVLLASVKLWEKDESNIPCIATGFGGGMARQGFQCGALTGGIMAIGVNVGRGCTEDYIGRELTYEQVWDLIERFKKEFGPTTCRDLTGLDLTTKEGQDKFAEENMHEKKCEKFVDFVARQLVKITGRHGPVPEAEDEGGPAPDAEDEGGSVPDAEDEGGSVLDAGDESGPASDVEE